MDNYRIPKIIHYCWFGNNELTPLAKKCILSWKKHLPEYEIKVWNEESFDINSNVYVKQAYENKKWAFVSDYVRLYAIYNDGGIYMDTDVEVIKPLDKFLNEKSFTGFEHDNSPITGIMGAEPKNKWIKSLLDYYEDITFVNDKGELNLTTNVTTITRITQNMYPIELNNTLQSFQDVTFYPFDYFCAKQYNTGKIKKTSNTHTIHHFSGSWLTNKDKIKKYLRRILGDKNMKILSKIKRKFVETR